MNWYKLYKKADRDNAILQRLKRFGDSMYFSNDALLNLIKRSDPTSNKQYSDWIAKMYVEGSIRLPEDSSKTKERLEQFNKLIRSPKFKGSKNIYDYRTYGNLAQTVQENLGNLSNKEQFRENSINGVELVIDKSPYKVYKITTEEGASVLCKNTEWCVKDPKYSKRYLAQGPLYLIMKDNQKYVLAHFESNQFMDIYDNPVYYKIKNEIIELLFPATGISKYNDAKLAYEYVRNIFYKNMKNIPEEEKEKLENIISTSANYSYHYAASILNGRFKKGELAIATDAEFSFVYAHNALKGRFLLGEPVILKSQYKNDYLDLLRRIRNKS